MLLFTLLLVITKLKQLNDQFNFKELSMGMSTDYVLATKLGATFVRIGSAIFANKN